MSAKIVENVKYKTPAEAFTPPAGKKIGTSGHLRTCMQLLRQEET